MCPQELRKTVTAGISPRQPAATAASAGGAAPPAFQGADSVVVVRDGEGYINAAVLRHQVRCRELWAGPLRDAIRIQPAPRASERRALPRMRALRVP